MMGKDNAVKETVVCTEAQFVKGEKNFLRYGSAYEWIPCKKEEENLARCVRDNKARITLVGTYRYRGQLYQALAESSGEGPP